MLVSKNIPLKGILSFAGVHFIWLFVYMTLITVLYSVVGWTFIAIPWLPVSLIGTAVAFYVGFKNSQSYDRMWEARKIWGAMVNSSRSFGAMVNAYIGNASISQQEVHAIKTKLIYRHIAYLYTLREQLLVPTQWEHVSLRKHFGAINIKRRENHGVGKFSNYLSKTQQQKYFAQDDDWKQAANGATYIMYLQTIELEKLQQQGLLDLFKQLELQKSIHEFYEHQGKAERINKFPFPRQYANMSFVFVCLFIFFLPFGIVAEFAKLSSTAVWLTIPFGALVGWIYVVMELIGDYSENPFEGLATDIPMLSICRTIEIDLLQMLNDIDIPQPIQPIGNVLM